MIPDAGNCAPADAAIHRRWPIWQIVLAYLFFFAVASGSVVLIDRDVMRAAGRQGGLTAVHAKAPASK